MQVLITILIILAVLLIVAFIPIRIKLYVRYENKEVQSRYIIKYGIITIKKTSDKVSAKHTKKEKRKKDEAQNEGEKRKTSVRTVVRFVKENAEQIKKLVFSVLDYVAKKLMRIERLKLNAVIGTEDAMQTALVYGTSSAFLYNALGVLDKKIRLDSTRVDYKPDFNESQIFIDFECIIKTRIHSIFTLAAIFLKGAFPLYRKRGDLANGKSD